MPVLTFDDELKMTPGGVPIGANGLPRVVVGGSKSNALTFDEFTPESTVGKVLRVGKDIGLSIASGLDKGVAGLAGLPADATLGINATINYGKSKVQGRPFEEVEAESDKNALISRDAVRAYGGKAFHDASPLKHTPTTIYGEFAQTGAEFVPAALLGPGNMARNALALGVAPGLASEAAGQATKGGPYEPYARAGTAIAGTMAGQWATAPNAAGVAVSRAARGATPQQIDQAEELFQRAQQMGVPLTRAEAVQHVTGGATNLGNLQRVVEGSGELRPMMAARPGQAEDAARTQFGRIGPVSQDPHSIGPAVGEAAQGTIQDVNNAINRTTRPLYDAARRDLVPEPQYQALANDPRYVNALRTIRNHDELGPEFVQFPDNAVPVVDAVKKLLNTRSEVTPVADATERYLASLRGTAGTNATNAGTTASAPYAQALAEQARLRIQYLNPLTAKGAPLGELSKNDIGTKQAIAALFPTNPLPDSQRAITQAVTALAHRNPGATRQLVRAHVESVFNEATQRLQSGANEFAGAGFAAVLRGNPQQAANMEAAITALRGGQTYAGFNRFLEVLEAQGSRQRIGSQTAFNQEVQAGLKTGGTVAEALSSLASGGIKLPSKINQRIEQWRMGGNVREIADILTNPDSARLFRQLATTPTNSAKAGAIVARLAYIADRSREN